MSITFINRGHFYAPHVKPCLIDCSFQVAAADAGGLGVINLKGQGVSNVFMHTSQTPGKGPNGQLNPNPQAGIIYVQLSDNFMKLYNVMHALQAPGSGSSLNVDALDAALTVGNIYVITAVGSSTAADWLALGVPAGVSAAVGVPFIAKVTGAGVGTGTVQAPAAAGAGINHIEVIGNPSLALGPVPVGGSPNVGGWIALACYSDSASDANVLTAPANGTVVDLSMYLSQSSVVVAGE